jgi:hypothetical protein
LSVSTVFMFRDGRPRAIATNRASQWVTIIALLAFATPLGFARTFTDNDGREIEADILHGTKDTVTVKMANGKEYTLPIAKFSDTDQEFITEWIKTKPPKVDYDFDLEYDRERTSKKESDDGVEKTTTEGWV